MMEDWVNEEGPELTEGSEDGTLSIPQEGDDDLSLPDDADNHDEDYIEFNEEAIEEAANDIDDKEFYYHVNKGISKGKKVCLLPRTFKGRSRWLSELPIYFQL